MSRTYTHDEAEKVLHEIGKLGFAAINNLPPFDDADDATAILQERNRNLTIENAKLEQLLKRIRFEIEQEADYNNAVVNADVARGLYHAAGIIDKFTKERNEK